MKPASGSRADTRATRTRRQREFGTSIAIAFSRSPMEVVQTAWDLKDLSCASSRVWAQGRGSDFTMTRFRATPGGWITGVLTVGPAREAQEEVEEGKT